MTIFDYCLIPNRFVITLGFASSFSMVGVGLLCVPHLIWLKRTPHVQTTMNFSSNRYGALDQLFDLDIAMTANGYNNGGSNNNPTSLSYSPETASLLNSAVYNPTGAARAHRGGTDLSSSAASASNGVFHQHSNNIAHHTLLTATNTNSNSSSAATSTYSPTGAPQYFASNSATAFTGNMSPFHNTNNGNANSTTAAAAAAAANTALRQMAAATFDPHSAASSNSQTRHHHAEQQISRSPLEELLMSAYATPSSVSATPTNSYAAMSSFQDSFLGGHNLQQQASSSASHGVQQQTRHEEEEWMKEITVTVPSLSLEPISGTEVAKRIKNCMDDVIQRYIPCVDFLVQCQQELRKGLAAAQMKHTGRRYRQSAMTPKQFWKSYIENLPTRFYVSNERTMERAALQEAVQGLHKLKSDSQQSVNQGCEAVKNSFLGGMKEGESWGLRKWLSKNGNALRVCTDLECILKACKELDKTKDTTKKLAALLRPLAKQTLDKLKKDVPASYQERSTAHPYLPFFHRLEGALRNMSQFDPEDDGIICLDDSDDDDEPVIVVAPPPKRKPAARKRKAPAVTHTIDIAAPPQKRMFEGNPGTETFTQQKEDAAPVAAATAAPAPPSPANSPSPTPLFTEGALTFADDGSSSGESDEDSVIQIVAQAVARDSNTALDDGTGWTCTNCSAHNPSADIDACQGCGEPSYNTDLVGTLFSPTFGDDLDLNSVDRSSDSFAEAVAIVKRPKSSKKKRRSSIVNEASHRFPLQVGQDELNAAVGVAQSLAAKTDRLAAVFDTMDKANLPPPVKRARKKQSLWDDLYSTALRIFANLLRHPDAVHFVEPIDEADLMKSGHLRYSGVIKNPLCLREILGTLVDLDHMDEGHSDYTRWFNGLLPCRGLSQWNMWRGSELLQALDLVFLNSLAYGKLCGEGRSRNRSRTNDLRKQLWTQIQDNVNAYVVDDEQRRRATPTRRSETSGFIVDKKGIS